MSIPRPDTWLADRFTFTVTGAHPQRFLNQAAAQNLRLEALRCVDDGYAATAAGMDRRRLTALAAAGGWRFTVTRRVGPGPFLHSLLARPGLPAGAALFFVLIRLLSGFVWSIDSSPLPNDAAQSAMRALLAEHGIYEGAYLTREILAAAQQQAAAQSEVYGWVSLNFTGGCLFIECSPSHFQAVQPPPAVAGLYAKAGGEVLSIEAESGFAAVRIGQYVTEGQMLVDCTRLDRSERPITQGASGRVIARVQRSYTATQPAAVTADRLTGRYSQGQILYFWGQRRVLRDISNLPDARIEWIPLRLGRLALPGCLCVATAWQKAPAMLRYSPDQAAALAARSCRRALTAEFPDAVIEAEQRSMPSLGEGDAQCTIRYTFRADIAGPPP